MDDGQLLEVPVGFVDGQQDLIDFIDGLIHGSLRERVKHPEKDRGRKRDREKERGRARERDLSFLYKKKQLLAVSHKHTIKKHIQHPGHKTYILGLKKKDSKSTTPSDTFF